MTGSFDRTKWLIAAGLVLAACGGQPTLVHSGDGGVGSLSGVAVKGPIASGTVTAYRLSASFQRGASLATATTDASGAFSLALPAYSGPILLVVSSGSYGEEAYGASVKVDGHELTAVLPAYKPATKLDGLSINAVTHFVAKLASFYVAHNGQSVSDAVALAQQHLNSHFGGLDWSHVEPTNFAVSDGGISLSDPDKAGLLDAALSQEALSISTTAGVTPGSAVSAIVLVETLGDDLAADGFFDGVGPAGPLVLPVGSQVTTTGATATKLDGQAVRLFLALSASRFLEGTYNATTLKVADAQSLLDEVSKDADPQIFRGGGTAFDQTPPIVTVTDATDKFQQGATITFTAKVDDGSSGSGVQSAFAIAFGDSPVAGVLDPATGLWTFTDVPLAQGKNIVTVWGVDKANNSGQSLGAPYKAALSVFVDNVAPVPSFDATVASYIDERGLGIATNSGLPVVPVVYAFSGTTSKGVVDGSHPIYKVSTRLSWGSSAPTGDVLEGANPNNTPFLRIAVPYTPDAESPITSVTFTATTTCGGCATTFTDSGQLIASAQHDPARVLFDLPISSETVTALAKVTASPAAIRFSVTAKDAAGNQTVFADVPALYFHILGPPLATRQDASYSSAGDTKSVYPYSRASGNYHRIWAGGNGGEIARAVRFVVYNPYPVSIPAALVTTGTSNLSERWDGFVGKLLQSFCSTQGACANPQISWIDQVDLSCISSHPSINPNVPFLPSTSYPFIAGTASSMTYPALPSPTSSTGSLAKLITANAHESVWTGGNEVQAAPSFQVGSSARFVVPPAVGNTPGSVVVYAGRIWIPDGLHIPDFAYQNPASFVGPSGYYEASPSAFWTRDGVTTSQSCSNGGAAVSHEYQGYLQVQTLGLAQEQFTGTLAVTPYASGPTAASSLEESGANATLTYDQTVNY